jgi:hypothetical protein
MPHSPFQIISLNFTSQLEQCFTFEQLCDLAQDPEYGHSFTKFLSHISRTYASVDQQYQVAKAIAKSARHSEERLTRFENIVHYAKGAPCLIFKIWEFRIFFQNSSSNSFTGS